MTRKPSLTRRLTMIAKFGSEEEYLAAMKAQASRGGKLGGKAGGIEYSKYGSRPKGAAKRKECFETEQLGQI